MRIMVLFTLATLCIGACASPPTPALPHERLHAVLYHQHAAEYRALCRQVFSSATERLSAALADPQWSADPTQTTEAGTLPPAVILDIDETVLDNTPLFGRLILDDTDFDLKEWNRWVVRAEAGTVPGAAEFIAAAQAAGVTVFFITNRDARLEGYTRINLARRGIVLDPGTDTLLALGERPEWTADKQSRRAFVAQRYRILLNIGDDLGDFVSVSTLDREGRLKVIHEHASFWGVRWFMLPNPIYGSWLDTILRSGDRTGDLLTRKRAAVIGAPHTSDEEMHRLMQQPIPPFPHQTNDTIIPPAHQPPSEAPQPPAEETNTPSQ